MMCAISRPTLFIAVAMAVVWSSADALGKEEMISNKSFFNLEREVKKEHHRVRRSTDYKRDEQKEILDLHNQLRGKVEPEAANMIYMEWHDDLATMAQLWSNECRFEHGQTGDISSPYGSTGQNLWIGTGYRESNPPPATGPTQSWYNEVTLYNYETKECTGVCGHYTQVVWATSRGLGCGRTFCPRATSSKRSYTNAWIVTCNYGPAGNYQGALPYKAGSSCTLCDSGVGECYGNQCRLCEDHNEKCACALQCQNCGILQSDCTCRCQDGWYGPDCSTYCEDTHENCGKNPGWPGPGSCSRHPAVPRGCPLMCGICKEEDPNFPCDRDTEVESGVSLKLKHDVEKWKFIQVSLRGIIGSVATDTCNTAQHITACCPAVMEYTSSDTLSFVNGNDVRVVSGYPKVVDSDPGSYVVLVVVRPPVTSDLCNHGSQSGARRKRESEEASVFLNQEVLLTAIKQNKARIEQELNVTVSDVYTGEAATGGGISAGVVVLIIIIILLVIAAGGVAVFFYLKKKQKQVTSNENTSKGTNKDSRSGVDNTGHC